MGIVLLELEIFFFNKKLQSYSFIQIKPHECFLFTIIIFIQMSIINNFFEFILDFEQKNEHSNLISSWDHLINHTLKSMFDPRPLNRNKLSKIVFWKKTPKNGTNAENYIT